MVVHLNISHHLDDSRIKGKIIKSLISDNIENVFIGYYKDSHKSSHLKEIVLPKFFFLNRIFAICFNFFQIFLHLNQKIFFLHNFELLALSPILRLFGKIVIYDAHEDYRNYVKQNDRFSDSQKRSLSKLVALFESFFANKFCNLITCPTNAIKRNFLEKKILILPNYPLKSDFKDFSKKITSEKIIVYTGLISKKKGILELMEIAKNCQDDNSIKFIVCGKCYEPDIEELLTNLPQNISYLGDLKHSEIIDLLEKASIGLCLLKNTPAYSESMPLKIFEYINSETFVIASNFEIWKFMEENNSGKLFEPNDAYEISKMIKEFKYDGLKNKKFYFDNYYQKLKEMYFQ